MVFAHSPQAKGRVERAHQTLQDRLTKELRLRGISTSDAANAFAPLFAADYNRRFAHDPHSPHDAHRPLRPTDDLEQVLRWKEVRKLTQNLTVHYKRSLYLVEETHEALALRGKLVEVHETQDGVVHIRHEHTELAARAFRKEGGVTQQDIEDNKYLASTLRQIQIAQLARDEDKLPTLTLRDASQKPSLSDTEHGALFGGGTSAFRPSSRRGRRGIPA
jgi:hypothetical protein